MSVQELVANISQDKEKLAVSLRDHLERIISQMDWAMRGFEVLGMPVPEELRTARTSTMDTFKILKNGPSSERR